jgi:ubiquitin-protein ligase
VSVRLRRLQADHEQVKEGLRDHPAIAIVGVSGTPPDRYQIEYTVRSLTETADGVVVERPRHTAEVYLTLGYPRQAPQCRMLTPVFHPNIAPHAVCIGDHWAAGESLLELIVRVGEMLAFQSYNVKSPLNGAAARWVEEHVEELPTDARDLAPKVWLSAVGASPAADCCDNCSATGVVLDRCAGGHRVCPSCVLECGHCGRPVCLLCGLERCAECGASLCTRCRAACPQCRRTVCADHLRQCSVCATGGCSDCAIDCSVCGLVVCLAHVAQCAVCAATLCPDHVRRCAVCGKAHCPQHLDAARGVCARCAPTSGGVRRVRCASCGGGVKVREDQVGKRLRCPRCGAPLSVS